MGQAESKPPSVTPPLNAAVVSTEWRQQAERDLVVARHLATNKFHEWACYASQQAAEKAIKSVRFASGIDVDGDSKFTHDLVDLVRPLRAVAPAIFSPQLIVDLAKLTRHEADGRYPGTAASTIYRAPLNSAVYNQDKSREAVKIAERVVRQCSALVLQLHEFWRAKP